MKNSEFQKAYLSLLKQENEKCFLKAKHSFIIKQDVTYTFTSNGKTTTLTQAQYNQLLAQAAQQSQASAPPTQPGWWEKAWDVCVDVSKKLPVVGDLIALCSNEPEKGAMIKATMDAMDVAKAAFTPEQVKAFRQALNTDQHLKKVVADSGIDINDNDQVLRFAAYLRQQAAIAKKAEDDQKFKNNLINKIAKKRAGDKSARNTSQMIHTNCPKLFRAIDNNKVADGTYYIHLED